ncbi:MAG TPA: O-antigen ligase family protein [Acetobacteraceae bacterium]|nr:O-antigen ligase family protein [Acetobacteraceae bacterium]
MAVSTAAAPKAAAGAASPWTSPALPLAVGLAVAPAAAVLQSKALAPIALLALAACVLRHRQRHGAWPWPRGAAVWAGLALFAWGAASAVWALQPLKALGTSAQIGGFLMLGAAACRAVAEDGDGAKRRLMRAACCGLAAGLLLAALDHATGNAVRAAVRGLKEVPAHLHFGLKPAASAMALWLPLVAAADLPRILRGLMLAVGAAVLLLLPGETPKIAVVAAAAAGGAAMLAPRWTPRLLGAGLALAILLMPFALGPVLARGVPADGLAPSAAHRLLIWDFVSTRIAERPVLGWGMEASRAVPGRDTNPSLEALARFRLAYPVALRWELLPLHPHNGALQLWLELGLPGALLGAALAFLLGLAAARAARPAVATAMLATGAVTAMLSFGAWQEWWIGAELMAAAAIAGLPQQK